MATGICIGAGTVLVMILAVTVFNGTGAAPAAATTPPLPFPSGTFQSTIGTTHTYADGHTDYTFTNTLSITTDQSCGFSPSDIVLYVYTGPSMIQVVRPPKACSVFATATPGDFVQSPS